MHLSAQQSFYSRFEFKLAAGCLIGGAVVWAVVGLLVPFCFIDCPQHRGLFGDQFGAANALFSGIALIGAIVALLMQRRELQETAQQNKKAILATALIQLLDDIRSQRWGDAHAMLREWRRTYTDQFVEKFVQARSSDVPSSDIDQHRRAFVEPLYKLWALGRAEIVESDAAKRVINRGVVETLTFIVEPMDKPIAHTIGRQEHWNEERGDFFQYFRDLFDNLMDSEST